MSLIKNTACTYFSCVKSSWTSLYEPTNPIPPGLIHLPLSYLCPYEKRKERSFRKRRRRSIDGGGTINPTSHRDYIRISQILSLFSRARSRKSRGVMIPALDPDPESEFQLFGYSDRVKSRIVTPIEVLCSGLGYGSGVRFSAFW